MVNNRQSQKPTDELYSNFKANFAGLRHPGSTSNAPGQVATSLAEALDIPLNRYECHCTTIVNTDNRTVALTMLVGLLMQTSTTSRMQTRLRERRTNRGTLALQV